MGCTGLHPSGHGWCGFSPRAWPGRGRCCTWRRWACSAVRPGAHIKAAIEVMADVLERPRPAASALSDWGKSHRFAGSSDRAAIGNLLYDALRRRRSLAAQMGTDLPRAVVLAAAPRALGLSVGAVAESADGSPHAVAPLS